MRCSRVFAVVLWPLDKWHAHLPFFCRRTPLRSPQPVALVRVRRVPPCLPSPAQVLCDLLDAFVLPPLLGPDATAAARARAAATTAAAVAATDAADAAGAAATIAGAAAGGGAFSPLAEVEAAARWRCSPLSWRNPRGPFASPDIVRDAASDGASDGASDAASSSRSAQPPAPSSSPLTAVAHVGRSLAGTGWVLARAPSLTPFSPAARTTGNALRWARFEREALKRRAGVATSVTGAASTARATAAGSAAAGASSADATSAS